MEKLFMDDQKDQVLSFDPTKVDEALKNVKSWKDLMAKDGPFQLMFKDTIERVLKVELEHHLGYSEKDYAKSRLVENKRNGSYKKTIKTTVGPVELKIPRDRDGSFEPKFIPKNESIEPQLEGQIISMYAKGLSTRDICEHLKASYCGIEVSPSFISDVTDKILEGVNEWQNRPLESLYPIIFMDAIHFKVKHEGKIISKAAYVILGFRTNGIKDILGIYIGENESSSFWLTVLTDIQNRGVQDILIACIDGLKGFPEAIASIYPKTEIQLCIIHQIRNSLKYLSYKDRKEFTEDLKKIYKAPNEEIALTNLSLLDEKWGKKYNVVIKSWQNNWDNLSAYFKYSQPIRELIYTTNLVEGFNRQLRKATKNKVIFPTDNSLKKMIYLALLDISKKWSLPRHNWGVIISQLSIYFEGRFDLKEI